jgi:hypothetical protein
LEHRAVCCLDSLVDNLKNTLPEQLWSQIATWRHLAHSSPFDLIMHRPGERCLKDAMFSHHCVNPLVTVPVYCRESSIVVAGVEVEPNVRSRYKKKTGDSGRL